MSGLFDVDYVAISSHVGRSDRFGRSARLSTDLTSRFVTCADSLTQNARSPATQGG